MQTLLNIITANDIRHTRFYQDAFGDGEQKGLQKGEAELILRLLARRCGAVSAQQNPASWRCPRTNWRPWETPCWILPTGLIWRHG
jgi:hypothetical protein